MQVVTRTPTPVPLEAIPGLIEAGFGAVGRRLTPLQRLNLSALVALETNRGRAVWNGNLGNVTAGKTYEGPVWRPPWFEVAEGSPPNLLDLHARMLAGTAPSAFRAYDSVESGARDFAKLLMGAKYQSLMRAADQPDADVFRRALTENYSKDYRNPEATRSLLSLQRTFGLSPMSVARESTPTVSLLVFAFFAWWGYDRFRASSRRRASN